MYTISDRIIWCLLAEMHELNVSYKMIYFIIVKMYKLYENFIFTHGNVLAYYWRSDKWMFICQNALTSKIIKFLFVETH